MSEELKCTCPCIDCIEGNHCGGVYIWPDDNGDEQIIGECHHITDEMYHEMGIVVDGCDCHNCDPGLYEDDDDFPRGEG
jgi:hypothetical protein